MPAQNYKRGLLPQRQQKIELEDLLPDDSVNSVHKTAANALYNEIFVVTEPPSPTKLIGWPSVPPSPALFSQSDRPVSYLESYLKR